MRIRDWSSDVCSSDLLGIRQEVRGLIGEEDIHAVLAVAFRQFQLRRSDLSSQSVERSLGGCQGDGISDVNGDAALVPAFPPRQDRQRVVKGKRVSVRVDLVGRRIIKKKQKKKK